LKKLIILDFDGTIYNGDSMLDFARFLNLKRYRFSFLVIAIPYALSLLNLISRNKVKQLFIKTNFKDYSETILNQKGVEFFKENKHKISPAFLDYIAVNSENHTAIILSGSCQEWLLPFSEFLKLPLYSTQLSYNADQLCLGNWKGKNIIGREKVELVKKKFNLKEFDEIIAFGDSKSDKFLEEICTTFHFRYFLK